MNFKVWKTLRVPVRKSTEELRNSLIQQDFKTGLMTDILLGKIRMVEVETTLTLVKVSMADICFPDRDPKIYPGMENARVIRQKALRTGKLALVPQQAAVELRLSYADQPCSKFMTNPESSLTIGSEEIWLNQMEADQLGGSREDIYPGGRLFNLSHDDSGYFSGIGLFSAGGYSSGASFVPSSLWVFALLG